MDMMKQPAGQTPDEMVVAMKKQHLMKAVVQLGALAVESLSKTLSSFLMAGKDFYTESLQQTIDGAVASWNANCENLQWISTLKDEAKLALSVSTSLIMPHTYTGCTSATTITETASAAKREPSDSEASASSGSESDESTTGGKETSFYIYKNKDGTRSKRSVKEKIKWKNSYMLQLKLTQMTEDGPRISFDATSIISKTDVAVRQQVATMKAWFRQRADDHKAAGKLTKEKLGEKKTWQRNYTSSSSGNYQRRRWN